MVATEIVLGIRAAPACKPYQYTAFAVTAGGRNEEGRSLTERPPAFTVLTDEVKPAKHSTAGGQSPPERRGLAESETEKEPKRPRRRLLPTRHGTAAAHRRHRTLPPNQVPLHHLHQRQTPRLHGGRLSVAANENLDESRGTGATSGGKESNWDASSEPLRLAPTADKNLCTARATSSGVGDAAGNA